MKIDGIKNVDAWAVDCYEFDEDAYTLRIMTPLGNPCWYKFTNTGFQVVATEPAMELEAAFQEFQS